MHALLPVNAESANYLVVTSYFVSPLVHVIKYNMLLNLAYKLVHLIN